MPTLRSPVSGSWVTTHGSVTNRPPSSGQHLRMGMSWSVGGNGSVPCRQSGASGHDSLRLAGASYRWTTSLQGPELTVRGRACRSSRLHGLPDRRRGLGLHEESELLGGLVDRVASHAQGHPPPGTERVDGDGEWGDAALDGGLLEQERLAAPGLLHLQIGDRGDLKLGGDGFGNPPQLAGLVEMLDPVTEGFERHGFRVPRVPGRESVGPSGCRESVVEGHDLHPL
jgi:hypothetical protein